MEQGSRADNPVITRSHLEILRRKPAKVAALNRGKLPKRIDHFGRIDRRPGPDLIGGLAPTARRTTTQQCLEGRVEPDFFPVQDEGYRTPAHTHPHGRGPAPP